MEKLKVYHNPRCSKSRMSLAYLDEKGIDYEIVDYLNEIPSKKQLQDVLKQLGMSAHELIRKGEAIYKDNYKGKELSESEWIDAMIAHPKLIERPIVISGNKAVVARPTEAIEALL